MSWLRTLCGIVALVTLSMVVYPPSVLALIEVRSGPGLTYQVMAKVPSAGSYVVVAQEQDWYKIQLPDGRKGWIHRFYVEQAQPPSVQEIGRASCRARVDTATVAAAKLDPPAGSSMPCSAQPTAGLRGW